MPGPETHVVPTPGTAPCGCRPTGTGATVATTGGVSLAYPTSVRSIVSCRDARKWPKYANGRNLPHMVFIRSTSGSADPADPARSTADTYWEAAHDRVCST